MAALCFPGGDVVAVDDGPPFSLGTVETLLGGAVGTFVISGCRGRYTVLVRSDQTGLDLNSMALLATGRPVAGPALFLAPGEAGGWG